MRWLKAKEVAARLGVGVRHFREVLRFKRGFPKAYQPAGARPLWAQQEIEAWVQANRR